IRVETERAIPSDRWHHVAVSYDGTRLASGVKVYIDGTPEKLKVNLDDLNQSFKTKEPFRIGAGGVAEHRFVGLIDEVRVYNVALPAETIAAVAVPESIADILSLKPERRRTQQALKVRAYYLDQHAGLPIRDTARRLTGLLEEREKRIERI